MTTVAFRPQFQGLADISPSFNASIVAGWAFRNVTVDAGSHVATSA